MKTYEAIEKVSQAIIADDICEGILVKGSIGRGDDDEYSDVDMYVIVNEEKKSMFLEKRMDYLKTYKPVLYEEHVYFVAEQIVAIFDDGLHFDLYTVTEETLPHSDMAKIIYDPYNKFANYNAEMKTLSIDELGDYFNNALYYFIEADGAFCRKNYPWAAAIMMSSVSCSAILLRYLYDKDRAYLGLKKINEIIPSEQFNWIVEASNNLNKDGFKVANEYIIRILDFVLEKINDDKKVQFNVTFYDWIKNNLGIKLFNGID